LHYGAKERFHFQQHAAVNYHSAQLDTSVPSDECGFLRSASSDPVTQRDIAQRAGVTVMAVSRALRGRPGVSKEKAEEIRRIADELGYVTNPLVASLMKSRTSRRSPSTGLVIAWYGPTRANSQVSVKKDIFSQYFLGAKEACNLRGFRLEIFDPFQLSEDQFKRVLRARNIPGILIGPKAQEVHRPDFSQEDRVHVVQIGRSYNSTRYDRVVGDSFGSLRRCAQALRSVGIQRIGYLDTREHQKRTEDRWLGAYLLEKQSSGCPPGLFVRGSSSLNDLMMSYIKNHKPEGLIVGGGGFVHLLMEKKKALPFVCLEQNLYPKWISGTFLDFRNLGAEAAQVLTDKILGPQNRVNQTRSIVLQHCWHEGTSHLPAN